MSLQDEINKQIGQPDEETQTLMHPGHSHALGCAFNGVECLDCCCGLPNKPKEN